MFIGAPMASLDQVQYNAHRIYGCVRLPMLTANWEVLRGYGKAQASGMCGMHTCEGIYSRWQRVPVADFGFQPLVVLRNLRLTPCQLTVH